ERYIVEHNPRACPLGRPDAHHAILASRYLIPLKNDRPDDLSEGEAQHGHVDARDAYAEPPEHRGTQSRRQGGAQKSRLHSRSAVNNEHCDPVSAQPEVRGMTKRDHSAVAHDEMEARGE